MTKTAAYMLAIVSVMLQTSVPYASSTGKAIVSPDGTIVVNPPNGCTVLTLSEAVSGKVIAVLDPSVLDRDQRSRAGPTSRATSGLLSFSPNGKLLATQCTYGPIILWKTRDGSLLGTVPNDTSWPSHDVATLQFSQDSRLIIAIRDAGSGPMFCPRLLTVWEVATQKELFHVALGEEDGFEKASFSPDGRIVMAFVAQRSKRNYNEYAINSIKLWDIRQAKELIALEADPTTSASFSRDGRSLLIKDTAFGGPRAWDIKAGKMVYFEHMVTRRPQASSSGQPLQRISADNTAESVGNNKWNWTVFIKGDTKAIDQVDHVQYTLHPSFRNPVRVVRDRGDLKRPFALSATGWGTFNIGIRVFMKDGTHKDLERRLKF